MTIVLVAIGLITLPLFAAIGYLFWLLNDTCIPPEKWRIGKLTPTEIDAALRYAAAQSQEAAAQSQIQSGAKETIVTEPAKAQNAPREPQIHHLVDPRREARAVAEWEAQQQAEREAQQQAEREALAAIQRDFPAWLIELAEKRNLKRDYSGLQELVKWIDQILAYGQEAGRLSVPLAFEHFRGCDQAPAKASSWFFFRDLLKALEVAGLIQARPGNAGRLVLVTCCCSRFAFHEIGDGGH